MQTELYEGSGKKQTSLMLGVRLDQYFSNRIALSWNSEYYRTKVSGYDFETDLFLRIGYKIKIQHFLKHKMNLRIYPLKRWSIGLGVNCTTPTGGHWLTYDERKFPFSFSSRAKSGIKGWQLLSSYAYKNFLFLMSYENSRGFTIIDSTTRFNTSKIKNITLTLSYRFQILKKPLRLGRKNKVKCAEF